MNTRELMDRVADVHNDRLAAVAGDVELTDSDEAPGLQHAMLGDLTEDLVFLREWAYVRSHDLVAAGALRGLTAPFIARQLLLDGIVVGHLMHLVLQAEQREEASR